MTVQTEGRKRKSKPGSKHASAPTEKLRIVLDYALSELPSTQHRAGLAGLVLMLQWLERQPNAKLGLCRLTRLDDRGASLEVDLAGLKRLLDETYAATTEDQEESQPRRDKLTKAVIPPLREEERTITDTNGKTKNKRVYVYPVVVPKAGMLLDRDPTAQGNRGLWVKLWRDMVWSTLRGVSATRAPFEARAKGINIGDVEKIWTQILRPESSSVELPSTYFLGAQARTAENVPFRDRARFQFLLHFWPYAIQVYVPTVVNVQNGKRKFTGFALAVPDVADLETFCEEFWELLPNRGPKPSGFRPRDAIVDLAIESGLDMAARLRERLTLREGARATGDCLLGVEVFHLAKKGNNVRMLSASRIKPDDAMNDEYWRLRHEIRDPMFRRTRILNLVNRRLWYAGFDRLLETLPYASQGIGSGRFRHDARVSFNASKGQDEMSDVQVSHSAPNIEDLVYQLVGRYVRRKVEAKTDLKWNKVKDNESTRSDYNNARSKLTKDAFLAVRSRTGSDFVDYFAGTLCSVPHRMKPEQFVALSRSLREDADTVRTLTLLALSAHG